MSNLGTLVQENLGKENVTWMLDDSLKDRARALVERFMGDLGHVDLRRIAFARVVGIKGKWFGKCHYVGYPENLISHYIVQEMLKRGILKDSVSDDLLDVRYIITLNDTAIRLTANEKNLQDLEDVTLFHELLHVNEDMDGLEPHNIKDFAKVLDRFGVYWTNGQIK